VISHRIDVAVLSVAFAVFGLVTLALVWSGGWAYEVLARTTGHTETTFLITQTGRQGDSGLTPVDLPRLLHWHGQWASYVIGISSSPPSDPSLFTAEEVAHMADVRELFRTAETAAVLALGVMAFRLMRARGRDDALAVLRDGALVASGLVAIVGIVAAVAFETLFLLFHQVFFPQGNFLFPPTSNLLRLYPEWYWQGITAGVGVSFIAVALLAAAAARGALRRSANTYTRAA
jgi:hypothetical protein